MNATGGGSRVGVGVKVCVAVGTRVCVEVGVLVKEGVAVGREVGV